MEKSLSGFRKVCRKIYEIFPCALNTICVVISYWYTCPSWRKLARAIGVSKIFINLKEKRTSLEEVTISMLLFSYFSFAVFIQNRTPQISNFCNVVIGMKFGSDFNFGQSQIFKMVFCFWVVGLIWSDYGVLSGIKYN